LLVELQTRKTAPVIPSLKTIADHEAEEAAGLEQQKPPVYAKTGLTLITNKMRWSPGHECATPFDRG
jgi:hypothetical protein